MTSNQLAYGKLVEDIRHNKASEAETYRHNTSTEGETYRFNVATEGWRDRTLNETYRHNVATENLQQQQIGLGYAQLGLGYAQLQETSRHNVAYERETSRHNVLTEQIQGRSNAIRSEALKEETRHNLQSEWINQQNVAQKWTDTFVSPILSIGKTVSTVLTGGLA